jgi:hypothetical protein
VHLFLRTMSLRYIVRALVLATVGSLLLGMEAVPAKAGGSITVEGGTFEVAPESAFPFEVMGESADQTIGSFSITVNFDPAILQAVSCQSPIAYCNKDPAPGVLVLNAVSLSGWNGDVEFGTIVFEVLGPSGSETPIDLNVTTMTDTEGSDLSASLQVIDGEAVVNASAEEFPLGDATCDGVLDASDGLAILGKISGAIQPQCSPLGDFNCDDSLNTKDALDILRTESDLEVDAPECP